MRGSSSKGGTLYRVRVLRPYALSYQGPLRFLCVTALNTGLLIALAVLWLVLRVRPSFLLAFAFRWITWSWLTLYLFPYVADVP